MKKIVRLGLAILLLAISAHSLPPYDLAPPSTGGEKIIDIYSYFDVNNILMFVTNQGGLCEDWSIIFSRADGFYFPYSGNCDDCYSGQTVVYSAGLFLGGKVNGEIRVAVGAYDSPEYYQGPADENGVHLPDNPRFKVYKIRRDSSVWLNPAKPECAKLDSANHFDDWTSWQDPLVVQDGAPLDYAGNPLLLGDETLWTVFNDGGEHNYDDYGGGTNPLGIEVHQTVWGYDLPGDEGNILFIKYKLYNKSPDVIDSFYISFWADPDLGGSSDDYVGCDTMHDMFFCYNADNDDPVYGSVPPAWGGQIVSGPVVPSPGDTAIFDGHPMPDHKNIGMTSFNKYINSTDPDIPIQTYGYLKGYDAVAQCPTCPYIDPNTGDTTRFPLAGDPLTGTGWLDSNPSDRRLMANMGPITFNPGDSQCVVIKIGAGMEGDRLTSLCKLKDILDSACIGEPTPVPADSIRTEIIDDTGLRDVYFEGSPQWLAAVNWAGSFFSGSSDYGTIFWGGYLNPLTMADSFCSVEVLFTDNDPVTGQRAYSYCRGCDPNYTYLDYVQVPFQAWDIDHGRQLNACFVEYLYSDVFDGTWGPDTTIQGGREYLLILNSDYDGDDHSDAGTGAIDYTTADFYDGSGFDFLYAGWYRVADGYSISDMDNGQKVVYEFSDGFNHDPDADSIMFGTIDAGDTTYQELLITGYTSSLSSVILEVSDPLQFAMEPEGFIFENGGYQIITINFMPQSQGYKEGYLYVKDSITQDLLASVRLVGGCIAMDVNEENIAEALPVECTLSQNYPNPFNPVTALNYSLERRSAVEISIYNLLGQRVKTIVNGVMPAGNHTTYWDGTDSFGKDVSSGIYFYRIEAGDIVDTKKMVLMR